jgi:plastocyanin
VVPRRVAPRGAVLALALLLAAALLPALASGSNRRIAISDYHWSDDDLQLNLGEHVTWYWTGPDTMHSVTGDSPASAGLDSDPNTSNPNHDIGDSFKLEFDKPGVYKFRCKLHSLVKGTVTVSPAPGDPNTEPDPVPKSNVDLKPPRLTEVKLGKRRFGRRGTNLRFAVGEDAKLSADYYRYDREGRRHFTGYADWSAHTGYNGVKLATKRNHFSPRPGSYLAVLRATDDSKNVSDPRRLTFHIRSR